MTRLCAILAGATFLGVQPHQQGDAVQSDRQALQGSWVLAGGEELGRVVAPDRIKESRRSTRWTFDGDTLRITEAGESAVARYSLDVEASPKEMDVLPAAEPQPTLLIYELDGDTLRIAFDVSVDGPGRPAGFEAGEDVVVLRLRRESPAERQQAEAGESGTRSAVTLDVAGEEFVQQLLLFESPKEGWDLYDVKIAALAPTIPPPATLRFVVPGEVQALWTPGTRSLGAEFDEPALSDAIGAPVFSLVDDHDVNRLTVAVLDPLLGARLRTRIDATLGVTVVEVSFFTEAGAPLRAWRTALSVHTLPADRASVLGDVAAWWERNRRPWSVPEE